MRISDWSSDVCSSDLIPARQPHPGGDAIGHMRRQPDASADIDPVIAIASGVEQRKSTRIGIGVNVERPAGIGRREIDQTRRVVASQKVRLATETYVAAPFDTLYPFGQRENGRTSCRERVCEYV